MCPPVCWNALLSGPKLDEFELVDRWKYLLLLAVSEDNRTAQSLCFWFGGGGHCTHTQCMDAPHTQGRAWTSHAHTQQCMNAGHTHRAVTSALGMSDSSTNALRFTHASMFAYQAVEGDYLPNKATTAVVKHRYICACLTWLHTEEGDTCIYARDYHSC